MRVLLADDHAIIRSALKLILADVEPGTTFEEVRGYEALEERLAGEGPALDMVVMDLHMPGFQGLAQVRRIVTVAMPAPVAVFSMIETVSDMRAVLRQGVRAFIPKSTDDALIGTLFKLVAHGGTYAPVQVGGVEGQAPGEAGTWRLSGAEFLPPDSLEGEDPRLGALTRRQREVLDLMGQGLSNMEIASRLGLNLSTVKTHVTSILKTLEADNRTQAVLLAHGLEAGG
ncbi:response regulator transcription factor [Pararhodospirillum oryzae]|uniref:DNA-binding response regulator n=1 Tax=Pararhodospirillum oryzae TaxID=478448 RepID=A0A512H3C1_9PROT|nr:response regulator transcription factor [Pararhodospirillum oryzae]GEO79955.1 DNA-binding response regulator [Pararhodospirillum oryzae]